MSFNISNVCIGNYNNSITTSENQSDSKDTQKSKKNKQIISEKDAKYCYTYVIDENGNKILLSKILVADVEKQKNSKNGIKYDETNLCNHNLSNNGDTDFDCKQQMYMEADCRKNLREIMEFLKGHKEISNL